MPGIRRGQPAASGRQAESVKTKDLTLTAAAAALICIAGPLSVFIGPVPLSLATFAVYMAGAVLGARRGAAATALYLLIGVAGMPVFSGFSGGFQKLAGVTGGYLAGYLPCAFLTGDAAKIAAASLLAGPVRRAVRAQEKRRA